MDNMISATLDYFNSRVIKKCKKLFAAQIHSSYGLQIKLSETPTKTVLKLSAAKQEKIQIKNDDSVTALTFKLR